MRGGYLGCRAAIAAALGLGALALLAFAASASAYVYWANGGTGAIGRAANDGTHVEPAFITGQPGPIALAVDATHLYWANTYGHSIGRATLSGSVVETEFIKLPYEVSGVAVDATHVYWSNGPGGRVGRAALNGSSPELKFIEPAGSPCGLAVDSGHLYWAEGAEGPGFITRVPLSGTPVQPGFVQIPHVTIACGVAVNPSNVYWTDPGLGGGTNIGRANLNDGKGVDMSYIGAASGPCGIAVLGSKLIWANAGTATIGRANTDATGVEYEFIPTGAAPKTICGVAADNLSAPAPPPPADTTPPQTKITNGPGGRLAKGRARFSFSSSEAGSSFGCKLEGKKVASCRSPRAYSGLQPGRHTFRVWATDAAGNRDATPAKRRFRVPG